MSSIPKVNTEKYLRDLAGYRQKALTRSAHGNFRRQVGQFTFGKAWAAWLTEKQDEGVSILLESGLRRGEGHVLPIGPRTHLLVPLGHTASKVEVMHFSMDLGRSGAVWSAVKQVNADYRRPRAVFEQALRTHFGGTVNNMEPARDHEGEFAYREMKRGADGGYRYLGNL